MSTPGASDVLQPVQHRGMITVSIMLATIIQALDGTIANVALPHMQGNLSATQDQITWVLTSFIVASAITMPLTGWLCDRFGRKQVLLMSIAGFTLASVLCGLAGSLTQIVLARFIQGVFGAALVPLSQAVLLDINPPHKHGSAMAVWGVGVMIGPILGPTLGGWLTDAYDWRWVFFINVPVGALALYGSWRYIPHTDATRRMSFDLFGFATLSLAIGALQLLLDRGEQNDWFASRETWAEAIVLAVSVTYFTIHTALRPAGQSFFDYRLLRNANFVTGLVFIFIVGMVLFATRALTPSLLQGLFGYPATDAGMVTAPSGLGTMVAMMIVGRLVGRVDVRPLIGVGFALTAYSLWQMSRYTLVLSEPDIVWPGVVQGVGLGLVFVPLSTATFSTLQPEIRADGTAIYSLFRNIGSSVGIALVQALLSRNAQVAHAALAETVHMGNAALQDPAVSAWYGTTGAGAVMLNAEVTRQATMISYVDDFWLMFLMTLAIIPMLVLMRPGRSSSAAAMAHAAAE